MPCPALVSYNTLTAYWYLLIIALPKVTVCDLLVLIIHGVLVLVWMCVMNDVMCIKNNVTELKIGMEHTELA